MRSLPSPARGRAVARLITVVLSATVGAALLVAAVLVPAPAAALPVLLVACIGLPLVAGLELPHAVTEVRASRALADFRRAIERVPEAPHPLGL